MNRLYYKIIDPDRKFYYLPLYLVLRALSIIYNKALQLRLWCYHSGFFPVKKLDCRVVSVGNLTLGGTGKTPMVMMMAEILRRHGCRPAILSRGYKGKSAEEVNVVCDGQSVLLSPDAVGDEPVMMARKLKNIPILTGRDRYKAGLHALQRLSVDTLILDDGFQRLDLHRDLNILLLDHRRPFGNGRLFPAGHMREPLREIRRADLICITRYTGGKKNPDTDPAIDRNIPIVKAALRLESVIRLDNGEALGADCLKNRRVAAFCGIAQPDDFKNTLETSQARVVYFRDFADHHAYSPSDQKAVEECARRAGAEWILTTEKDSVKLQENVFTLPVLKVCVGLKIIEGQEAFDEYLLDHRRQAKRS
ncbi:MAG: tetraacyldisaccharide 4'-kinase [Nitrospinales bacterium]